MRAYFRRLIGKVLDEVLDNVFQHSHVEQGFVMASVTYNSDRA